MQLCILADIPKPTQVQEMVLCFVNVMQVHGVQYKFKATGARQHASNPVYVHTLGIPLAFLTFSTADNHWRSLHQHMPRFHD